MGAQISFSTDGNGHLKSRFTKANSRDGSKLSPFSFKYFHTLLFLIIFFSFFLEFFLLYGQPNEEDKAPHNHDRSFSITPPLTPDFEEEEEEEEEENQICVSLIECLIYYVDIFGQPTPSLLSYFTQLIHSSLPISKEKEKQEREEEEKKERKSEENVFFADLSYKTVADVLFSVSQTSLNEFWIKTQKGNFTFVVVK